MNLLGYAFCAKCKENKFQSTGARKTERTTRRETAPATRGKMLQITLIFEPKWFQNRAKIAPGGAFGASWRLLWLSDCILEASGALLAALGARLGAPLGAVLGLPGGPRRLPGRRREAMLGDWELRLGRLQNRLVLHVYCCFFATWFGVVLSCVCPSLRRPRRPSEL